MLASELAKKILSQVEKYGEFEVIVQGDDEGNTFRRANGVDLVVRQVNAGNDDYCYDSMEDGEEDGHCRADLEYTCIIY